MHRRPRAREACVDFTCMVQSLSTVLFGEVTLSFMRFIFQADVFVPVSLLVTALLQNDEEVDDGNDFISVSWDVSDTQTLTGPNITSTRSSAPRTAHINEPFL